MLARTRQCRSPRRRPPRKWTLEAVVAALQRHNAVEPITTSSALVAAGRGDLVSAVHRHIGSWERALRMAGIGYEPRPRRSRTRDDVLREIRRLHRAGKPLTATGVEPALLTAASRRFGGWRKARATALPRLEAPTRSWTASDIAREIRRLHKEGTSLSATRLRASGHGRIVNAAVRHFGSWRAACQRAIPNYRPLQQTWTAKRVLAELRNRQRRGESVSAAVVTHEDLALCAAASRYFGSWREAIKASGVEPAREPFWTPSLILSELSGAAAAGKPLTSTAFPGSMATAAHQHFGSWLATIAAAGLTKQYEASLAQRTRAASRRRRGRS